MYEECINSRIIKRQIGCSERENFPFLPFKLKSDQTPFEAKRRIMRLTVSDSFLPPVEPSILTCQQFSWNKQKHMFVKQQV